MKWMRLSCVIVVLLGLAAPAGAGVSDLVELNNAEIPGSVLVFPKFIKGTVQVGTGCTDADCVEAKSTFDISVTCPSIDKKACADGDEVWMKARWVCPAKSQNPRDKFICPDADFYISTTVKGTLSFGALATANYVASATGPQKIPTPPCDEGYLIVWVVDKNSKLPIQFDALTGVAVLRRHKNSAGAYNGIPIQAVTDFGPVTDRDTLVFDGGLKAGDGFAHYKALTGKLLGTVRYEREANGALGLGDIETHLTLLTLDVITQRPNYPTFVDLLFYNEEEVLISTSHEFICWTQVELSDIDSNLEEDFGKKGLFETTEATKIPIFGITDGEAPRSVNLLGIVEVIEFDTARRPKPQREYGYSLFNDGIPVPSTFEGN